MEAVMVVFSVNGTLDDLMELCHRSFDVKTKPSPVHGAYPVKGNLKAEHLSENSLSHCSLKEIYQNILSLPYVSSAAPRNASVS